MPGVGWKLIFLSRCVSVFVVWFLWNNLIKVAGWLNSQRKLGYICLSFPLKSLFPPSDAPSRSHFHHLVIIWKGRGARAARKLPLSHYFCNYFSGCQKIRPNHNPKKKRKEKGKMLLFDRILIWRRLVVVVQTPPERCDFLYRRFQRTLSSAGIFFCDIIHTLMRLVVTVQCQRR